MNSAIIGHDKISDFFDKVILHDNLSHAYCFSGPEQVGKRTVAEYISAQILNVPREKLGTQPDFSVVEQELNDKTGKTKKNIDIEQIRDLRSFLSQRSFLGGYKIAVIDKAEKMNANSANSLLKILEEPKNKMVIFLLTKDETLLPSTIQSRCQMIYFSPVNKNTIKKYIESRGFDCLSAQKADEMARLSSGLPGRACIWAENVADYEVYRQEIMRFVSLFHKPFYEKLQKTDELFGDKSDHVAERGNLQNVLDIWLNVLRGFMHAYNGVSESKLKIKLDNKKLLRIINLIQESKNLLAMNIHPRLLVEQVLLEIP